MALPKDNPNAATDAVAAEIKKMGPKDLAALPELDGGDLQLIGTLIRVFLFHGSQSPPRAGDIPRGEDAAEGVRQAVARQPAGLEAHRGARRYRQRHGPGEGENRGVAYLDSGDRQHAAEAQSGRPLRGQALQRPRCVCVRQQELQGREEGAGGRAGPG